MGAAPASEMTLSAHPTVCDMAKRKPEFKIQTYGVYTHWAADSKELPHIQEFTTQVQAYVGVEFGFVMNVKGGRNHKLHFCIDHPGILGDDGRRRRPFQGEVYVKGNDWNFYLGDTIWEPIADKLGRWHMSVTMAGKTVAEKTFELLPHADPAE